MVKEINSIIVSRKTRTGYRFITDNRLSFNIPSHKYTNLKINAVA